MSWVAAIGALIVAIVTLYAAIWLGLPQLRFIHEEQERIRKQLERRAELQTRILLQSNDLSGEEDLACEAQISPTWSYEGMSEPITLAIETRNVGELTGLDILFSYHFPVSVEVAPPSNMKMFESLVERLITASDSALNPQQIFHANFDVRVPRGLPQFEIDVVAGLRDAVPHEATLTVRIVE